MTVVAQIILRPEQLKQFPGLSEDAIQRAIQSAKTRIQAAARDNTPVGNPSNWRYAATNTSPGQLSGSFDIGSTPRSIVMKWSALFRNFDYAEIVEKGRSGPKGFPARNYAAATKQHAKEILLEELLREFTAIGGLP